MGMRYNPWRCVVALAIREAVDATGEKSIMVDEVYASIDAVFYRLPKAVRLFVEIFDCCGRKCVEPFSFELGDEP